jgi:hypothetical protein
MLSAKHKRLPIGISPQKFSQRGASGGFQAADRTDTSRAQSALWEVQSPIILAWRSGASSVSCRHARVLLSTTAKTPAAEDQD